jgi:hypothetical protein
VCFHGWLLFKESEATVMDDLDDVFVPHAYDEQTVDLGEVRTPPTACTRRTQTASPPF